MPSEAEKTETFFEWIVNHQWSLSYIGLVVTAILALQILDLIGVF